MRLFFAIQLTDQARETLRPVLDTASRVAGGGVGFTRLEQLHFTLAFLGETEKLDDAIAAAESVRELARFTATEIALMQSILGPGGAKHETRDTIPFSDVGRN